MSSLTKGLLLWTFLDGPATVELSTSGGQKITRDTTANYSAGSDLEFDFVSDSGTLTISLNGAVVQEYTIQITLGGLTTTIPPARSNQATAISGYILSVGIFDAPLLNGLKDQLYVNIAPDQSSWMGTIPSSTPFWAMCLPGAHDAGMNTVQGLDLIKNNPTLLGIIMGILGPTLGGFVESKFEDYAIWLGGLTQKDSITTMLAMGIRFFDVRPGFSPQELVNAGLTDIRHQHSVLPGALYLDILTEILQFLSTHPTEIVQISVTSNGFVETSMTPSAEDLNNIVQQAMSTPGVDQSIQVIGPSAFTETLETLQSSNSRLILTDSNHGPTLTTLDAWNTTDWATLDPSTIQGAYTTVITPQAQTGNEQTTFQVQATATDAYLNDSTLKFTLLAADDYNLPLTSTKGNFDAVLFNFILTYQTELNRKEHLVCIDDWADGATVSPCIAISLDRAGRLQDFVDN